MRPGRWSGVGLTGVATLLWLAVVIMVVTTPPDAGANIGGGLVGLVALALSIRAAVLLIKGAPTTPVHVASSTSMFLWIVVVALGWSSAAPRGVIAGVGAAAIVSLGIGAVLTAAGRRRPLH